MADQVPDVVGVGRLTLDQIGVGPRMRDPDMMLSTFSVQAGGPTGTALATMAAFGAKTRDLTLRHLGGFGVDTSLVLREADRLSPTTFILLEEETGRRYIRHASTDVTPLEPKDLPPTLFDGVRLAYFDAEMPTVQIACAEGLRHQRIEPQQ